MTETMTSLPPITGIYFFSIMAMCTISVAMTVIVLVFHHATPEIYEMPEWVRQTS